MRSPSRANLIKWGKKTFSHNKMRQRCIYS
jgi:hypothetical protein